MKRYCEKKGIYRCSNDGQTKFFEQGELMEPCSCGQGQWEYRHEDNIVEKD